MILPIDLQKYAKKQIIKRWLLFFVYLVLIATVSWAVLPELSKRLDPFPISLICLAAVLFAAYFSKVLNLVFEKNWSGKIAEVKVETKTGSYSRYGKTAICEKNTILLIVEKENGKTVCIPAETFVSKSENGESVRVGKEYEYSRHVLCGKPEEFLRKYRKGDLVYHFRGIERNVIVAQERRSLVTCAVCGMENDAAVDRCHQCGYTLLKLK